MRRRPSLAILFLIVFIDLLGFGLVIPMLPLFGQIYGASSLYLGFLLASYSALQFLFAPIWGRLSDRFGRKPILLLSLAGSAAGYLIFASARSIAVLIFARALAGLMAANISTAQAYIADITPPEGRAKGMGVIGAAFGLGFTFGPFVGGFLASLHGGHALAAWSRWVPPIAPILENLQGLPGLFATGLSLTALVLTAVLLPESLRTGAGAGARRPRFQRLARALRTPQLGTVLLLFFLYTFSFTQVEVTLAQLIDHRFGLDISRTYWMFAWIGILSAVIQGGLIGPLTRRFGERVLASTGIFLVTASLSAISFVPTMVWFLFVLGVLAVGAGLTAPSLSSLVSRLSPPTEQGGAFGVFQSLSSIARIIGPVVAQMLYQRGAHVHAPYLFASLIGMGGFALGLWAFSRPLPAAAPESGVLADAAGGGD